MPPEVDQNNQDQQQQRSPLADADRGGGDQQQKPTRPEGLADDFWNDEKGVDFEKLLGQHKELSEFKAAQDAAAAGRPQKADDYKLELPKDFAPPEGVELELDEKDPRLAPLRELALKHGWSQEQFSDAVALDAQFKVAEQTQLNERLAAEMKSLGTNGKARVDAVTTWLNAKLGNELGNALVPMIFTAKQTKAFEKLIELTKGAVPDFDPSNRDGGGDADELSEEEWNKLSRTDQITYARQRSAKSPTLRVKNAAGGR